MPTREDLQEFYETMGDLCIRPKFAFLLMMAIVSAIVFLSFVGGHYWPRFCEPQIWTMYGIVGGVVTMFICSTCIMISWIVVDENSWFFTAVVSLTVSVVYITCGYHFFVDYGRTDCRLPLYLHRYLTMSNETKAPPITTTEYTVLPMITWPWPPHTTTTTTQRPKPPTGWPLPIIEEFIPDTSIPGLVIPKFYYFSTSTPVLVGVCIAQGCMLAVFLLYLCVMQDYA